METKESILNEIVTMVSDMFDIEPSKISSNSKLYDDLGLDSIDAIDMVLQLQDKANIEVDAEEFRTVRTVQDIVDAVYSLLQNSTA